MIVDRQRFRLAIAATLAIVVVSAAFGLDPAQGAIRSPTADGNVSCGRPGVAVISWTVTNYPEVPVAVDFSASMNGAANGPVTLAPNPLPPGSQATATVEVDGTISGGVSLRVTMNEPFAYTFGADVVLSGACPPPPPPPPPPPAPDALERADDQPVSVVEGVRPTYVG